MLYVAQPTKQGPEKGTKMEPSTLDLKAAAAYHGPEGRGDCLNSRDIWSGKAPDWCDLACRVCFNTILPNTPAVDTGCAPFHKDCFEALKAHCS